MATKLSKEERRREKDLLAARQAGNVMPEQDVVTGKSINPHIPEVSSMHIKLISERN